MSATPTLGSGLDSIISKLDRHTADKHDDTKEERSGYSSGDDDAGGARLSSCMSSTPTDSLVQTSVPATSTDNLTRSQARTHGRANGTRALSKTLTDEDSSYFSSIYGSPQTSIDESLSSTLSRILPPPDAWTQGLLDERRRQRARLGAMSSIPYSRSNGADFQVDETHTRVTRDTAASGNLPTQGTIETATRFGTLQVASSFLGNHGATAAEASPISPNTRAMRQYYPDPFQDNEAGETFAMSATTSPEIPRK